MGLLKDEENSDRSESPIEFLTANDSPCQGHHHVLVFIKLPICLFTVGLAGFVLVLIVRWSSAIDHVSIFRETLVQQYTDAQGQANDYLDSMHQTHRCCGVFGMRPMSQSADPAVFQPNNEMLFLHLPESCCQPDVRLQHQSNPLEPQDQPDKQSLLHRPNPNKPTMPDGRCTYERIYPQTCDSRYAERVTIFRLAVLTLLGISLLEKVLMLFVFEKFAGSLLSQFSFDCIPVQQPKRAN